MPVGNSWIKARHELDKSAMARQAITTSLGEQSNSLRKLRLK